MKGLHKQIMVFAIGIILCIVSFPIDALVFEWTAQLQNAVCTYFFEWISFSLSLIFVLLIMTSLFMWEEGKREWILPTWFSFFAALVLSFLIKFIVARERPLEAVFFLSLPDYSFPSAHAAVSFAVVPILDKEFPLLKWFWILFAALVAVSRLYLAMHFLSDVIAGIVLGYAIGVAMLYLKDRHAVFR